MPEAPLISLRGVSKSYRDRPLFRDLTLHVSSTERLGVVGPNGAGKTTLLGILAGRVEPDAGERVAPRPVRVGWVEQSPHYAPDRSVRDVVLAAWEEMVASARWAGDIGFPEGQSPEGQIAADRTLGRLGFANLEQPVGHLSGGWLRRLTLACALVGDPDLLLLDEPTNHLDLETILWLEGLLGGHRKAFVLVSHDRAFLQQVARRVIEVAPRYPGGTFLVQGPYTALLERRAAWLEAEARRETAMASRLRRELAWLSRGARARTTKARGRQEAVAHLQQQWRALRERKRGDALSIDFHATDRKTRRLLVATNLGLRVGSRWLVQGLDLVLTPGLRLGLVGPNGSGKTTLLRALLGERDPDAGSVLRAPGLKMVYFDQQRQTLEPDLSLRHALAPEGGDSVLVAGRPVHVASWARRFGFRSEQLETPVSHLSGGEQARILISRLVRRPADVLLLDEPTNDLDIDTLEVLEQALCTFPGAVVLVSHDRYLLSQVTQAVLALDALSGEVSAGENCAREDRSGEATLFADVNQWLAHRAEQQRARKHAAAGASRPRMGERTPRRRKPLTYGEELELGAMESRIEEAEAVLSRAEAALQDPAVQSDAEALAERYRAVEAARQTVDTLYARWAELEEKRQGG